MLFLDSWSHIQRLGSGSVSVISADPSRQIHTGRSIPQSPPQSQTGVMWNQGLFSLPTPCRHSAVAAFGAGGCWGNVEQWKLNFQPPPTNAVASNVRFYEPLCCWEDELALLFPSVFHQFLYKLQGISLSILKVLKVQDIELWREQRRDKWLSEETEMKILCSWAHPARTKRRRSAGINPPIMMRMRMIATVDPLTA